MSDGTTVGKIQLGVELPELDKQIGEALKGVEGKIGQALGKAFGKTAGAEQIGTALSAAFDKGLQSAESASKRMTDTMNAAAENMTQKLDAVFKRLENLKIQPEVAAVHPTDVNMKGSMAMPKLAMPRAPPMKVDLDRATQIRHLEQQLSVLDQRWEALDGIARRHGETVERLQAEYQNLVNNAVTVGGKKFINEESLEKARGDIAAAQMKASKAVEAVVSLEQAADRIRAKMKELSDVADQPADAIQSRLGRAFDAVKARAAGALAQVRQQFTDMGRQASGLGGPLNNLINRFTQAGNSAQSAGRRGSFSMQSIARSITMVARRLLILNVAYRILRGFISYVSAAANTSEGFASSLATIKLNLAAAFQPILNVILPILNTLAAALAKVTGHVAAFVAALFGTTYKASVQGAREMKTAIDGIGEGAGGVGDVGKKAGGAGKGLKDAAGAAEKLKGALAGFDEINVLNFPDDSAGAGDGGAGGGGSPGGGSGGGGGGPGGWEAAAAAELGDTSMWDKLANVLKGLFEPFKKAWENEGANTIAAMKFMLQEVLALLAAIGRSFYEVWTNGTGQEMLERILRILQQIFYLVGEVARAFRIAWEENGRGTQIIQNIFDGLNNLLYVAESLMESLRNVWRMGGQEFATQFTLAILTLTGLWEHFTGEIRRLWDAHGKATFESFAGMLLEIGIFALFIWNNYIGPAIARMISGFAVVAGVILDILKPAFDAVKDGLEWLRTDGKPVLDVIMEAVVLLATAFLVVKGAAMLWAAVTGVLSAALAVLSGVLAFLTSPITLVILAIGGIVLAIKALVENWDAAKNWLEWAFGDFGMFIAGLLEGIGGVFQWIGDQIARLFPSQVEEGTSKAKGSFDAMGGGTRGTLTTMEEDVRGSAAEMAKQLGWHIDAGAKNWQSGMSEIDYSTELGLSSAAGSVNTNMADMLSSVDGNMADMLGAVDGNMAEMLSSIDLNSSDIEKIMAEMSAGISTDVPLKFGDMNLDSTQQFGDMTDFVDAKSKDMQRDTTAEMEMLGRKTQYTMKGIKDNTIREFTELHDAVKKKLTEVTRLASTTATSISRAFGAINLYSIGQNIVNSLSRGMTSRSSALYSNLSNMVSRTISSVKRGYGIASPSKVFTFFGEMLPAGLIKGIDALMPQLDDKVDEMVSIPDIVEPQLANIGRSENAIAQQDAGETRTLLNELLTLLKTKPEPENGDMHVAVLMPDGSVLARTTIKEYKKMQKQDPQGIPSLGTI